MTGIGACANTKKHGTNVSIHATSHLENHENHGSGEQGLLLL